METPLVAIPAYNAGARLAETVVALRRHWAGPLLVVDDGSDDGCAAPLNETLLRHDANRGKGAALASAFDWALEQRHSAVLTLDGDGQHDPASIPSFIAAAQEHPEALHIGVRKEVDARAPWPSRLGNRASRYVINRILGMALPDTQCGFRMYPRAVLEAAPYHRFGPRYEFETEFLLAAHAMGFPIAAQPVPTIYQADRVTHFRQVQDSLSFLGVAWRFILARDGRKFP